MSLILHEVGEENTEDVQYANRLGSATLVAASSGKQPIFPIGKFLFGTVICFMYVCRFLLITAI